jgi:hypothetical protein
MNNNNISATSVSRFLNTLDIKKSVWRKHRVTGTYSEGYKVSTSGNAICVTWKKNDWVNEWDEERRIKNMKLIETALIAKGYKVQVVTEKIWDGNKQATFGYFYEGDLRVTKESN